MFVGDVLEGTTTLTDVFGRDGSRGGTMTFTILETEYRDASGELVETERSTLIETENAIEDEEADDVDETVTPRIDGATVTQSATGYVDPTT